MITSWQKVLLTISCMAFVLACKVSKACGADPGSVDNIAYVVVGAIWGSHIPGLAPNQSVVK